MSAAPVLELHGFRSGPENRLAVLALRAVIQRPGTVFNPLYLYGPAGAGKSHLVEGLLATLQSARRHIAAARCSSDEYRRNPPGEFVDGGVRRSVRFFIVEDIQRLRGDEDAQQVLLCHFDELLVRQCQIVITGRHRPAELHGIDPRFVDRLIGGLAVAVNPPGPAARLALLEQWARRDQIPLPPSVARLFAERFHGPAPPLRQALRLLDDAARLQRTAITAKLVTRYLDACGHTAIPTESIARHVARYFGVSLVAIRSGSRFQTVNHARQVAMYLARTYTDCSDQDIGRFFHDRHRSTVSYACRKLQRQLHHDQELHTQIETLVRTLNLAPFSE